MNGAGGQEEALGPGEPHEEHPAYGGGDALVRDTAQQGELHGDVEGEIERPSKCRKVDRPGLDGEGGGVQHCDGGQLDDEGAGAAGRAVQVIPRRGRGRQGVKRDALLQLGISNFTVRHFKISGVGGETSQNHNAKTGFTQQGSDNKRQKPTPNLNLEIKNDV